MGGNDDMEDGCSIPGLELGKREQKVKVLPVQRHTWYWWFTSLHGGLVLVIG